MSSHKAASELRGSNCVEEPRPKVAKLTAPSCSTDVGSTDEPCSLGQQPPELNSPEPVEMEENNEPPEDTAEGKCDNCTVLKNRNRILQNTIRSLQGRLARRRTENRKSLSKGK